jgi:hypothetical protein
MGESQHLAHDPGAAEAGGLPVDVGVEKKGGQTETGGCNEAEE